MDIINILQFLYFLLCFSFLSFRIDLWIFFVGTLAAVCLGVLLLILEEKINVEDPYKFRDLRAG